MARQTFSWNPEYDASLAQDPSVSVTKFGDGYELRTPTGINNNREKWSLQFTQSSATYPQVLAFIQARNAVESFYWTTPLGLTKVFVCRSWKLSRKQGHNIMTFEFEQVFEA